MNNTNLYHCQFLSFDNRFEYSHYYGDAVYDNP